MILSDEELMMKVKLDKDTDAFGQLVQRYKVPLLNFVYRFIGDNETAQDLSQDVFVRLWANAETYLPIAKFTTFLWTIAKNVCLNAISKAKSQPSMQSLDETISDNDCEFIEYLSDKRNSPEDNLIGMEIEQRLTMAINKLSPEHRLVFILTEFDGLSYQEVANIMQCPVGTIASRKNNAVKALRRYLTPFKD